MSKPYKTQIKRLKWIIKNWDLIKNDPIKAKNKFLIKFIEKLNINEGLCSYCELFNLNSKLKHKMFKSFPKFSGSYVFPLSDFEDYYKISNLTDTPERLELAKHCLKFLKKQRNKELNIHE